MLTLIYVYVSTSLLLLFKFSIYILKCNFGNFKFIEAFEVSHNNILINVSIITYI